MGNGDWAWGMGDWGLPRLLTLFFVVTIYYSILFSLKAYLVEGLNHIQSSHILHEPHPKKGTESTA